MVSAEKAGLVESADYQLLIPTLDLFEFQYVWNIVYFNISL